MRKKSLFLLFLFLGCATYYPPTTPFDQISPASEVTRPSGPTVRIQNISNLDPEPIELLLSRELSRGGYSLVRGETYGYGRNYGFRASDWANYFPRDRARRNKECSACDRADYLLEVGARPVYVSQVAGSGSGGRYGYGASAFGEQVVSEVEIYIAFYDGRTKRAIPGKSSVARVKVRNFGAVAGEVITRALGVGALTQSHTYDPITEAAIRTIPRMFRPEGQR